MGFPEPILIITVLIVFLQTVHQSESIIAKVELSGPEKYFGYKYSTLNDLPTTTLYYYNKARNSYKFTYYGKALPASIPDMLRWLESEDNIKEYLLTDIEFQNSDDIDLSENIHVVTDLSSTSFESEGYSNFSSGHTEVLPGGVITHVENAGQSLGPPTTTTTKRPTRGTKATTTTTTRRPTTTKRPTGTRRPTQGGSVRPKTFDWREYLGAANECGWWGEKLKRELRRKNGAGSKITEGRPSKIQDTPWQAALYSVKLNQILCGGTIIGKNTVLTASHCIERNVTKNYNHAETYTEYEQIRNEEMRVIVGSDTPLKSGQRYPIRQVFTHSVYSNTHYRNDIALIEIEGSFEWSPQVYPACLPSSKNEEYYAGLKCRVSGFGYISAVDPNPDDNLRSAEVQISTVAECLKENQYKVNITTAMFCANNDLGGPLAADTCFGDSGGPLVSWPEKAGEPATLLGITSFGYGCGLRDHPGIYTRVADYLGFIENKLKVVAKFIPRYDLPFDTDEGVSFYSLPNNGTKILHPGCTRKKPLLT